MKKEELKLWFRESAWIYPEDDKAFIEQLTKALKENGFPHAVTWQSKNNLDASTYPQYICSGDLGGIGGDTIHFWRDGQTWWPITGDYTEEEQDSAERILRDSMTSLR